MTLFTICRFLYPTVVDKFYSAEDTSVSFQWLDNSISTINKFIFQGTITIICAWLYIYFDSKVVLFFSVLWWFYLIKNTLHAWLYNTLCLKFSCFFMTLMVLSDNKHISVFLYSYWFTHQIQITLFFNARLIKHFHCFFFFHYQ